MEKPKLFLLSPMLHQGGFERVCITTARLLKDRFDISIVIFDDANIAYDISGLDIINLNLGVKKGKIKKLINVFRRVASYRKLLKSQKPEVSYSFGPTANLVNSLSKVKTTKVWLGIRNYTDVEETRNMAVFSRFGDLIIACSKDIEAKIKELYPRVKTDVLYNLYDIAQIRKESEGDIEFPWEDGSRKVIISMGRDAEQKGFWHLVKAFKLVHDEIGDTGLVLLGAGTFDKYKKMATEYGIEDSIYFAGMRKDPYKFLKKADVYLLTSINEGFPNALVEGMCLGLAAVATDCLTGPREILDDGKYGVLVPPMDAIPNYDTGVTNKQEKELAERIVKLLKDEKELERYKKLAADRAKDFGYEVYRENFMKIYEASENGN